MIGASGGKGGVPCAEGGEQRRVSKGEVEDRRSA